MAFMPSEGRAQGEDQQPAEGQPSVTAPPAEGPPPGDVPPVEVEQDQPTPPDPVVEAEEPAPKPKPKPRPVVTAPTPPRPAPRPAPVESIEPTVDLPSEITEPLPGFYGPPGGQGNYQRTMESAQSPIVPIQGIVPGDLQDFSSAASRVTRQQIDEQQPLTTNDILSRVPGVAVVNDDGFGRHGGISIRGTPARRSRKILVMEDGRSINQSLWLDPSTRVGRGIARHGDQLRSEQQFGRDQLPQSSAFRPERIGGVRRSRLGGVGWPQLRGRPRWGRE
jgi:Fe(3+) dicitrate transport protein